MILFLLLIFTFFFNDTATTEIYTLSLHDALPIFDHVKLHHLVIVVRRCRFKPGLIAGGTIVDRKSTRLNSSHSSISYAVFCLKKKKKIIYSRKTTIFTINYM